MRDLRRPRSAGAAIALVLIGSLGCNSTPKGSRESTVPGSQDRRTPVPLPADGQQAVLGEMRQMLGAIGGALSAAANGDTAAVLAAIAPAGSAAAADPALEALLPASWKELAERTHSGFDSLATAVRRASGAPALKDTVLVGIGKLTGSCTACHEAFRVTVATAGENR